MRTGFGSRTALTASTLVALRGGGQGLEFIGWVVFARQLGTASFGALSLGFFAARGLGLVADWGATVQGARDVAAGRDTSELHALARWRLALGIGLAVIFATLVAIVGHAELSPLALCILSRGLARDWVSLGGERSARSSIPALLQGTIVLAGSVFAASTFAAASTLGVAYLAAGIVSHLLNRLPGKPRRGVRPTAGWFFLVSLAEQVFLTSDAFLIAWIKGSSSAGIYSALYRFPNAWMTVMGLVVLGAVPAVTRHLSETPEALPALRERALKIGIRLATVILLSVPVLVIALPILFGHDYASGRWALSILLLSTAVMGLSAGLAPLYYATRSDRNLALWTVVAASFNVALNLALIPAFGLLGAATSTLLAQLVLSGYLLVSTRQRHH